MPPSSSTESKGTFRPPSPPEQEFGQRLQRLDALIGQAHTLTDPAARAHTREVIQTLLEVHGAALARLLEHVHAAGEAGQAILDACASDDMVGGLLLLHGLHPLSLEQRINQALDQVRPYLRSHGGSIECLGVTDGVVRLRLLGSCDSCPSSAVTMQQTIEEAIYARAPDVVGIEVEGVEHLPGTADTAVAHSGARVALPVL